MLAIVTLTNTEAIIVSALSLYGIFQIIKLGGKR